MIRSRPAHALAGQWASAMVIAFWVWAGVQTAAWAVPQSEKATTNDAMTVRMTVS